MACNVIKSWTFTGLVGAFLDLSIAYLLLCGSTLAYLASKFLGLSGLLLPCPCNGLFGCPNKYKCLQAMLVDDPSLKIFSVQSSVKNKFPFDSIWNNFYDGENEKHHHSRSNLDKWQKGSIEMEGESSSSTCNEKNNLVGEKKGSFWPTTKRKGFGSQRSRVGLRRRKRATAAHGGKVLSFSNDLLMSITNPTGFNPSASFDKFGNDITDGTTSSNSSEDGSKISEENGFPDQGSQQTEVEDDHFAESKFLGKDLGLAEFECSVPEQNFNDSGKNAIRMLKQALREEHAARTALYLELEKERNAAATAVDEAMAMILRLQEEKAAVEMEARQYQRMIEEKSTFDAEEMNILKEILLRREKEKHFLEKEVEAYRQMFFEKEQSDTDLYDLEATQGRRTSSVYSSEEPMLMLQHISKSGGEKENTKINSDFSEHEITPIRSMNHTFAFGEELPTPEVNEDTGPLNSSIEKNAACLSRKVDEINKLNNHQESYMESDQSTTQGPELHEKAVVKAMVEVEEQYGKTSPYQESTVKKTVNENKIVFPHDNEKMEKHGEILHGSDSGIYYPAHDVYVIYDEPNMHNEENGSKNRKNTIGITSNLPRTCDYPTIGGVEVEPDWKSKSLDRSSWLPPVSPSQGRSLPPISRRNSMSAFDYERVKIDNEVGWLRERLKIVKQGREKLKFPTGCKEREHVQFQILENIASQLREIRQLTAPRKALQQASLPPAFSKVMSKKSRSRGSPDLGALRSI